MTAIRYTFITYNTHKVYLDITPSTSTRGEVVASDCYHATLSKSTRAISDSEVDVNNEIGILIITMYVAETNTTGIQGYFCPKRRFL